MTVDIITCAHPPDYGWLFHQWKSIGKHATGFRHQVIAIPSDAVEPASAPAYVRIVRRPSSDIVGGVTTIRFESWRWSDADVLVFMDCDCVFVRPENLADWVGDRPPVLGRSWESAGVAQCWRSSTELLFGATSPVETMCAYPFAYPRTFLREVHDYLGGTSGIAAKLAACGFKNLSEFNVWGNFAWGRPDQFRLQRMDLGEGLPLVAYHFWPRGSVDAPEVLAMMAEFL
jgi:hypothetical protein